MNTDKNKILSKFDRKIIKVISEDMPLTERPFEVLADKLKIKEDELLNRIKSYKDKGFMRKYCAVLNHINAGFKYNAMVAWNISGKSIDAAGNFMATLSEVSHCYERKITSDWNYNLYSMLHAKTKKYCLEVVKQISQKIGCKNYKVLFSLKEYKKTGVKY